MITDPWKSWAALAGLANPAQNGFAPFVDSVERFAAAARAYLTAAQTPAAAAEAGRTFGQVLREQFMGFQPPWSTPSAINPIPPWNASSTANATTPGNASSTANAATPGNANSTANATTPWSAASTANAAPLWIAASMASATPPPPWNATSTDNAAPWSASMAGATPPWEALFEAPALGLTREDQQRRQRMAAAARRGAISQSRLQCLWADTLRDAASTFAARVAPPAAAAGGSADSASLRRLYDAWIDCAEEAYARTAHSDAFCDALAEFVNAGSQWRRDFGESVERWSKLWDLPTRSELNSLSRRLQAVEEKLLAERAREEHPAAPLAKPRTAPTSANPRSAPRQASARAAGTLRPVPRNRTRRSKRTPKA